MILIKGMEMPTRCFSCPMCDVENAEVNCAISHGSYIEYRDVDPQIAMQARPDWCPLVPVPPHGRLIDADALIEDLERQCKEVFRIDAVSPDDYWITRNEAYNEALWKTWVESFDNYLKTRPTVIPADKDGET